MVGQLQQSLHHRRLLSVALHMAALWLWTVVLGAATYMAILLPCLLPDRSVD